MIIRKSLMRLLLFPLLVGCMGMNGCKSGLFNTEPFSDSVVDEGGNKLLADTTRNWANFIEMMDLHIASELDHARAPGVDTWNIFWMYRFKAIKTNTENPDRYINYIINSRREAGLPELVFEEHEKSAL